MRVGLVGGGYWGSKHLRVCAGLPEIDELYLAELDAGRRKSLVGSFPSVRGVESLADMLDDVDAVIIATKPGTHLDLGRQVLSAGKHCLIEKPLATSLDDALELHRLAEENDLVLMTGHTFEFNPVVDELKRRVRSDELGRLNYIRSLRLNLGLYQNDVNVIWDLAPHDVSIINFILDDTPTTVSTWAQTSGSAPTEDVAMLRLQYGRSDVVAYIHVSWLDPSKIRELTIVGDKKMAVYDDVRSQEQLRIFDRGVEYETQPGYQRPTSYRYGDITSPFIPAEEPLMIEDRSFVQAVRRGRAERSDGLSGVRVVAVMEAAQRSLEENRPVELAELLSGDELDRINGDTPGQPVIDLDEPVAAEGVLQP